MVRIIIKKRNNFYCFEIKWKQLYCVTKESVVYSFFPFTLFNLLCFFLFHIFSRIVGCWGCFCLFCWCYILFGFFCCFEIKKIFFNAACTKDILNCCNVILSPDSCKPKVELSQIIIKISHTTSLTNNNHKKIVF